MSTRPADEGVVADLAADSSDRRRRHRRPDDLAPYGLGERGVTYLAADIHPLRRESPPAVNPDQRRRLHGVAGHDVSPRRCSPRASSAPPSPHQRSPRSRSPRPRRRVRRSRSSPPSVHDGSPLRHAPPSFKELVRNLSEDRILDLLAFAWEADPRTRLAIEREVDADPDRRTLFLRDLPNDIPWTDVYDYFDGWGSLEWCRIHRNTSKRRITGHVRFVHRRHALKAARFPGKFIGGHSFSCVPHDPAFVPHRQSGVSLDHEVQTTGLPDVQDVHKIQQQHHLGFNTQTLHRQQPPQPQPEPGFATFHQQPPQLQPQPGFSTFHQQPPQLQPQPGFVTFHQQQPQLQPQPGFSTFHQQQPQLQRHPGFTSQILQQQQIHRPQQPPPQSTQIHQQLPPPPPPAAASATTAIFSEVRGDQVYGPEHHHHG